jgi:hypothetical protein
MSTIATLMAEDFISSSSSVALCKSLGQHAILYICNFSHFFGLSCNFVYGITAAPSAAPPERDTPRRSVINGESLVMVVISLSTF